MGRPGCSQCCEDEVSCTIPVEPSFYSRNGEKLGMSISELNNETLFENERNPNIPDGLEEADNNDYKVPQYLQELIKNEDVIIFKREDVPGSLRIAVDKDDPFAFYLNMRSWIVDITKNEVMNRNKTIIARNRFNIEGNEHQSDFKCGEIEKIFVHSRDIKAIRLDVAQDIFNVYLGDRNYSFNLRSEGAIISEDDMKNFEYREFFDGGSMDSIIDDLNFIDVNTFGFNLSSISGVKIFDSSGQNIVDYIVIDMSSFKNPGTLIGFGNILFTAGYRDHRVISGSMQLEDTGQLSDDFSDIIDIINIRNAGSVKTIVNALNYYKEQNLKVPFMEDLLSFCVAEENIVIPDGYTYDQISDELNLILVESNETLFDLFYNVDDDGLVERRSITDQMIARVRSYLLIKEKNSGQTQIRQEATKSTAYGNLIISTRSDGAGFGYSGSSFPEAKIQSIKVGTVWKPNGSFLPVIDSSKVSYPSVYNINYFNPETENNDYNIFLNEEDVSITFTVVDEFKNTETDVSVVGNQMKITAGCGTIVSDASPRIYGNYTNLVGLLIDPRVETESGCFKATCDDLDDPDCHPHIFSIESGCDDGPCTETLVYADPITGRSTISGYSIDSVGGFDRTSNGIDEEYAYLVYTSTGSGTIDTEIYDNLGQARDFVDENEFTSSIYLINKNTFSDRSDFRVNGYLSQYPSDSYREVRASFDINNIMSLDFGLVSIVGIDGVPYTVLGPLIIGDYCYVLQISPSASFGFGPIFFSGLDIRQDAVLRSFHLSGIPREFQSLVEPLLDQLEDGAIRYDIYKYSQSVRKYKSYITVQNFSYESYSASGTKKYTELIDDQQTIQMSTSGTTLYNLETEYLYQLLYYNCNESNGVIYSSGICCRKSTYLGCTSLSNGRVTYINESGCYGQRDAFGEVQGTQPLSNLRFDPFDGCGWGYGESFSTPSTGEGFIIHGSSDGCIQVGTVKSGTSSIACCFDFNVDVCNNKYELYVGFPFQCITGDVLDFSATITIFDDILGNVVYSTGFTKESPPDIPEDIKNGLCVTYKYSYSVDIDIVLVSYSGIAPITGEWNSVEICPEGIIREIDLNVPENPRYKSAGCKGNGTDVWGYPTCVLPCYEEIGDPEFRVT